MSISIIVEWENAVLSELPRAIDILARIDGLRFLALGRPDAVVDRATDGLDRHLLRHR